MVLCLCSALPTETGSLLVAQLPQAGCPRPHDPGWHNRLAKGKMTRREGRGCQTMEKCFSYYLRSNEKSLKYLKQHDGTITFM